MPWAEKGQLDFSFAPSQRLGVTETIFLDEINLLFKGNIVQDDGLENDDKEKLNKLGINNDHPKYTLGDLEKLCRWYDILAGNQVNISEIIQKIIFNNNYAIIIYGEGGYDIRLLFYEKVSNSLKIPSISLNGYDRHDLDDIKKRAEDLEILRISYNDGYEDNNFPSYFKEEKVEKTNFSSFYSVKMNPDKYIKPLDVICHVYYDELSKRAIVKIENWNNFFILQDADKIICYHPIIAFKKSEKLIEHIAKCVEGKYFDVGVEKIMLKNQELKKKIIKEELSKLSVNREGFYVDAGELSKRNYDTSKSSVKYLPIIDEILDQKKVIPKSNDQQSLRTKVIEKILPNLSIDPYGNYVWSDYLAVLTYDDVNDYYYNSLPTANIDPEGILSEEDYQEIYRTVIKDIKENAKEINNSPHEEFNKPGLTIQHQLFIYRKIQNPKLDLTAKKDDRLRCQECYQPNTGKYAFNGMVALKILNNSQNITTEFLQETINHKMFNGNNVVSCYGISQDPETKNYIMVMSYKEEGNLRQYLQKNYSKLSFDDKINFLSDITAGLDKIHEQGLIHKDFHAGNILCDHDFWHISDLGLCRPVNEEDEEKIYGVPLYVAPEVIREKKYTQAADIFSPNLDSVKAPQLLKGLIKQSGYFEEDENPQFYQQCKEIENSEVESCRKTLLELYNKEAKAKEEKEIRRELFVVFCQQNNYAEKTEEAEREFRELLHPRTKSLSYQDHHQDISTPLFLKNEETSYNSTKITEQIKEIENKLEELKKAFNSETTELVETFIQVRKKMIKNKESKQAKIEARKLEEQLEEKGKYPKETKEIKLKNKDFSGQLIIENYPNLEKLYLRDDGNISKDLIIENCPQIRKLNIRKNLLTNLEFLKPLKNLEELEIDELQELIELANNKPHELLKAIKNLKERQPIIIDNPIDFEEKYQGLKRKLASLIQIKTQELNRLATNLEEEVSRLQKSKEEFEKVYQKIEQKERELENLKNAYKICSLKEAIIKLQNNFNQREKQIKQVINNINIKSVGNYIENYLPQEGSTTNFVEENKPTKRIFGKVGNYIANFSPSSGTNTTLIGFQYQGVANETKVCFVCSREVGTAVKSGYQCELCAQQKAKQVGELAEEKVQLKKGEEELNKLFEELCLGLDNVGKMVKAEKSNQPVAQIQFTLEHLIGKGKLRDVAIKKLYLSPNNISQNDFKGIVDEINILKNLEYKYVIQYHGAYFDNQQFLIIMEYAKNGTLTKFINDNKDIDNILVHVAFNDEREKIPDNAPPEIHDVIEKRMTLTNLLAMIDPQVVFADGSSDSKIKKNSNQVNSDNFFVINYEQEEKLQPQLEVPPKGKN
ncbi:10977_t:CDS:10 [Racocetra fulgida]|uniref:10977_t:CDS:1 n=1 Tax=Racocetra fulgida TaxID=60492 RepID=A0A9N9FRV7_9GLOM|nr:10977_t:CDS:10 [Racocetra fulgida]